MRDQADFNDLNSRFKTPHKPESKAGNLYYVRLNTEFGKLYKLGFTSMSSLSERLAFQGLGHEKYIEREFCFEYFDDAYDLEVFLHDYFRIKALFRGRYKRDKDMPLYDNGQSELYVEDILGMDFSCSLEQEWATWEKIHQFRCERDGKSPAETEDIIFRHRLHFFNERSPKEPVVWPIPLNWVAKLWVLLFGDGNYESVKQAEKRRRAEAVIERIQFKARVSRSRKLSELKKELALREATSNKKKSDERNKAALKTDIEAAVAAFHGKDWDTFESIVDVNLLVYNLANDMTADLWMGSDYMGIANNCDLVALMDAMMEENPRDLLLKPVEDTYREVLRHLVMYRRLITEDLIIPDDPIYQPEEYKPNSENGLSSYYGPKKFLNTLGKDWTLPVQPTFTETDNSVQISVVVKKPEIGFEGALQVRVARCENNKLDVSFPNFLDLDEAACAKQWENENALLGEEDAKKRGEFQHRNQLRSTEWWRSCD